jgi:hypothetical protein
MSVLPEIKRNITQLSPEELTMFRTGFAQFDAEVWDRQFEKDVNTGRLDALAEKALKDLQQGNCTDL